MVAIPALVICAWASTHKIFIFMSLHVGHGIVNTTDCTGIFGRAAGKTGIISVSSAHIPQKDIPDTVELGYNVMKGTEYFVSL
jgi:hypothetical protein